MSAKSGAGKPRAKAVRVRKASIRFNGWDWVTEGTDTYVGPCFVITNPPPGLSCAKVKRLVEIAGMDGLAFADFIHKAYYKAARETGIVDSMREALGLSSPAASRPSTAKGIK